MEIYLRDLKQNEQVTLIKLVTILREQEQIPEAVMSTSAIYRFMKGNECDLVKALFSINESLKWRKTFDWKSVVDMDIEKVNIFHTMMKFGYYGEDAKGRPIRIMQPQPCKIDQQFAALGSEAIFAFQVGLMERSINIVFELCTRKYGRHISSQITIVDVKYLEIGKILTSADMINFGRTKAPLLQLNYPELGFRGIIINAGPVFYTLWKIFSAFLNKKTLEKIRICNEDYMSELLEITTIDKIPVSLGGTCPYEIDNYPNFFDQEFYNSVHEKRLELKK